MRRPKLTQENHNTMMSDLNDFMGKYGIEEINFGKTHKIKKTDGKHAIDIVTRKKK